MFVDRSGFPKVSFRTHSPSRRSRDLRVYCAGCDRLRQGDGWITTTYSPDVAQVLAPVRFERADFYLVVRTHGLLPLQPKLPTSGHRVAYSKIKNGGLFPVPAPPFGRMEAPRVVGPPVAVVLGKASFDFLHETGAKDCDLSSHLHKAREIAQVQVISTVVGEGINADCGVKEFRAKRE